MPFEKRILLKRREETLMKISETHKKAIEVFLILGILKL